MAIVRWRPMRDVFSIQDEMNRMFEDFFGRYPERREAEGMWSPSVDISETKDEVVISAEVPGMSKDDIKISLQNNVITIKGEKKQVKKEENENFHRIERVYGSFERSFSLPTVVQNDKIQANYKDGILKVVLPKAEEAKPKEISIQVK